MEDVIKQIIEIENKAQNIIDDAIRDKKLKEEEFKVKIDDLEDKIVNDAKRKVAQIREREFNDIKEAEEAKVRKCEKRLLAIDEYANENMDMWVQNLVDKVIS